MDFTTLTNERHSALNFVEGVQIPEEDFKKIYEMVKLSPSAFNLQPVRFLILTDNDLKDMIYELSNRQYKIHTSSAVVLALANTEFVDDAEPLYEPMKMLGMLDEGSYNDLIQNIKNIYALYSEEDIHMEAQKNAMVAVTSWLYASKELGWDSCPMHIHNYDKIQRMFNIPKKYAPVAMITMGKSYEKERKRGFRKPFSQACSINRF